MGIQGIKLLLKEYPTIPPRTIDLSNEVISHGAIDALSDLLSVNFGLKKLVLENCGIDDEVSLRIRARL
jgi:protein phosphatase 1 regulatory subunit 37